MSEKLHKHEFLLLLLDMGGGAENLPYGSTTLEIVDELQKSFDITTDRRDDIMYTVKKSDVIHTEAFTNSFQRAAYENMQEELQEWPFTNDNE